MGIKVYKSVNFDLISILDDAIDQKASDITAYVDTADASKLQYLDGMRPTIFRCRSLTARQMEWCQNVISHGSGGEVFGAGAMATRAFSCGLQEVINLTDAEGREVTISEADRVRGEDRLTDKWRDKSNLPLAIQQEIGTYVLKRSRLTGEDLKN